MSSLYYLGTGLISLSMVIYNFDVHSSGSNIQCFQGKHYSKYNSTDYVKQYNFNPPNWSKDLNDSISKFYTNKGIDFSQIDSSITTEHLQKLGTCIKFDMAGDLPPDIKFPQNLKSSNSPRTIIVIIAIIYLAYLIMSVFLSFVINSLSNQLPEDYINVGTFKKFFACFCKLLPPIFIILSWVNMILIIVGWVFVATNKCECSVSNDNDSPRKYDSYFKEMKTCFLINSIFWFVMHYVGAVLRAMTYVEPFMYDPMTGDSFVKGFFFKALGP